jgi:2-methylcitrate dehydratase PrpD
VFGGPGAAAAAGTVLGLDAEQLEDALGLAATQACGLMAAQFESMGKRMQHGFAARNGVLAATLAAGGYTGIKQVFERPYGGFLSVFGEGHDPDPAQITDGLGERWETEVIAVKPYAAMAGLHASIDAARELVPVDPDAIESITISVSEPAFHHGGWRAERPLTATGAQMNLGYAVAVTLIDGTALAAQFSAERIDADDVWGLIERTTLVETPRGGLMHPLTNDEVVEKFRALTEPLIDSARARALERTILNLDECDDVRDLVEPLAGPVKR